MSIRCLAIDDEPLALQQLVAYIEKIHFFQLVGQCHSALDAQEQMEQQPVDAIFIDINMPDLNGLQFIRTLRNQQSISSSNNERKTNSPIVVLTTAYSEYAIEGYKVSAIDYLLKPFSFDEFYQTALRVKQQYDNDNENDNDNDNDNGNSSKSLSEVLTDAAPRGGYKTSKALRESATANENDNSPLSALHSTLSDIFVKTEHRLVRISVDDILYVEGMSEYVKIHFISERRPLTVLVSMKRMEERLPQQQFMRIHRSTIINLGAITEVNKNRVVLLGKEYLPIGDLYRDDLRRYLDNLTLTK